MEGIITKKEYEVHSYEVDHLYNLLPEIILSYMQDIAMEQSERIGIGLDYLKDRKLHWIITRYHVIIQTYPKYNDKISVSTKAVGFKKLFAFRDFEITSNKGDTLISANSQWLLIDSDTSKMVRIDDSFYNAYGIDKNNINAVPFGKLTQPKNVIYSKNFRAGRSDIDFNCHVNNKKYFEWMLDTIPETIFTKFQLKEFDIVFKKEVVYGENIKVNTEIVTNEKSMLGYHEIVNELDEVVCCINTAWK